MTEKVGVLYLIIHNRIMENVGKDGCMPKKRLFEILGKIYHIPRKYRYVLLKELTHLGMVKEEAKESIRVLRYKNNINDSSKIYRQFKMF